MKKKLTLTCAVTCIALLSGLFLYWNAEKWNVEPATNWHWRSCLKERGVKVCGSPMGYDEAMWWATTRGVLGYGQDHSQNQYK